MEARRALLAVPVGLVVVATAIVACGGGDGGAVAYSDVQAVFEDNGCVSCHPTVNSSLDLREGRSYEDLVGVRALDDPTLFRVVAGDPERSFLYLKVGGAAPVADIPAIGTRMPPRAPPISDKDIETIRRWIEQGAKDADGKTGGPRVPTPGTPPADLDVPSAGSPTGTGTIAGSVIDEEREPVEGALVTLLLKGPEQEGGEEHYRAAVTDADGRFTLPEVPAGSFLLKAYAPETIYVSRIVALDEGERQEIAFGLPTRRIPNPQVAEPDTVADSAGTRLSMMVTGQNLDGNYTLAVHDRTGTVVELHNANNAPGRWTASVDRQLEGPWTFLAVDENCNVSEFLHVPG